jgi:hypothetical protein
MESTMERKVHGPLAVIGGGILAGWSAISLLLGLTQADTQLWRLFPGFVPISGVGPVGFADSELFRKYIDYGHSLVGWLGIVDLLTLGLLAASVIVIAFRLRIAALIAGVLGAVHLGSVLLDVTNISGRYYGSPTYHLPAIIVLLAGTVLIALSLQNRPVEQAVLAWEAQTGSPGPDDYQSFAAQPTATIDPSAQPGGVMSGGGPVPFSGGQSGATDFGTPVFSVHAYGVTGALVSMSQLQQMAKAGAIQPTTMVQHRDGGYPVPASAVPGVFSDKSYTTALLFSILLGGLGIDRFYLGYTGIGVAKLLTLGGCGIWSLVDLILIATRKVPDVHGKPLV